MTVQFTDYYKMLGVARDADEKEIKRAYRKLAQKYHPDVYKGPEGDEKFKEINEAYQVLSNQESRAKYDRYGADWERYQSAPDNGTGATDFGQWFSRQGGRRTSTGQAGPNVQYEFTSTDGSGFSDFFDLMFGRSAGFTQQQSRRQAHRGEDHEYPVEISMQEALNGTTRMFELQTAETCPYCQGVGITDNHVCNNCDGTGTSYKTSKIEVTIPAGVRSGSRIRVAGKGGPGKDGGKPGDVFLRVNLLKDNKFELVGNDLKVRLDVPLYTALLGGEVILSTLTGKIAVTIPPRTQNGQTIRLRKVGWPVRIGSQQRGDLLVAVNVVLPVDLDDHEIETFSELAEYRTGDRIPA